MKKLAIIKETATPELEKKITHTLLLSITHSLNKITLL